MCDACANAAEARRAWVALLAGQLPSHRANASRTKAHLGLRGAEAAAFDASYLAWEADYEAYLESVSRDEDEDVARDAGATLLDMVDEKERLLRARGLDDLFAGMKAQENAVSRRRCSRRSRTRSTPSGTRRITRRSFRRLREVTSWTPYE